jgi:two-component system OmpR family sensor kinase
VLVAAVVGERVVRRTLRPLQAVATTAHEVAGMRLDTGKVGETARVPEEYVDPRTEVGQVAGALNHLLGHVEGALDARHRSEQQVRQFVADASHELRTPLATIMGYAELARRNPDYDNAEALAKVESEGKRMRALVEDLLLLARLDAGRPLAREEVDLTLMALEGVKDAQVLAPDHEWVLDLPDEPVSTVGDGARLHQVLTNLLANARRHTPPGTTVTVSVSRVPAGARLRVADDGPGLPEELRGRVFERFTRADSSRTRDSGGAGLGLALVHAIVAAHGGVASVESRPGATAFTVDLPG